MSDVFNPAKDLAWGLQFGRNYKRQESDFAWQDRERGQQEVQWANDANDRAIVEKDRAYTELSRALLAMGTDPDTGRFDPSRVTSDPNNVKLLSNLTAGNPLIRNDIDSYANAALPEDQRNDPRQFVGFSAGPDGKVAATFHRTASGRVGPETADGTSGPDAPVSALDGHGLVQGLFNLVSAHNPEFGAALRAEAEKRAAGRAAGEVLGMEIDKTNAAVAPTPTGARPSIADTTPAAPAPVATSAPTVPAPGAPFDAVPGEQRARVAASLEAGLQDYLRKYPGAPKLPVGSQTRDTYDRMVRNIEAAKAPAAPAVAPEVAPKVTPEVAPAVTRQANSVNARAKQVERSGKVSQATREKMVGIVTQYPELYDHVSNLLKSPKLEHVADAGDRLIGFYEGGKTMEIAKGAEPAKPLTAKDFAELATKNMEVAKFTQKWVDDQADAKFDKNKDKNRNNWLRQAVSLSIKDGLINPMDPAAGTAMVNIGVKAVESDMDGFLWFNKNYSDYPSLSIPLLAMGLTTTNGKPNIRATTEALTMPDDVVARAGVPSKTLTVSMGSVAQSLVGTGKFTPQQALVMVQQAVKEDPAGFAAKYVRAQ